MSNALQQRMETAKFISVCVFDAESPCIVDPFQ